VKKLQLACRCGATVHMVADELTVRGAENLWRSMRGGPGHGDEDYLVAVQIRVRAEKDRLRQEIAQRKQGSN